ncbi:MAG: hypothetical protein ACOC9T_02290 [Myxococcota bacterium]
MMKTFLHMILAAMFSLSLAVGCSDEGAAEEPEAGATAGDELGTEESDADDVMAEEPPPAEDDMGMGEEEEEEGDAPGGEGDDMGGEGDDMGGEGGDMGGEGGF